VARGAEQVAVRGGMVAEKMIGGSRGGLGVARFVEDPTGVGEGANRQSVPACDDFGVEQRLLALEARFVKFPAHGLQANVQVVIGDLGEVEDILFRLSSAMVGVGEIGTAVDSI